MSRVAHICAAFSHVSLLVIQISWNIWSRLNYVGGSENLNKTTSKILSCLSIIFAWLSFTLMEVKF